MKRIRLPNDPRLYQIAVLGTLVAYGVIVLDFNIHWYNAPVIAATALLVQFVASKQAGIAGFDAKSPLITALSLTLLLRTDDILLAAAAALIAIGSKFAVRFRGKHVFNPANVAIVSLMFLSDRVWISTGQWGNAAIGALALACLGFIVLTRARRAETTLSFLLAYALLLFGRALWLGDPLAIPLHHLQNGALLIFAFFMISDPKTTPNTPAGRIFYGAIVAAIAFLIQFELYQPNGPVIALILAAPLVPLIDFLRRGDGYQWNPPRTSRPESTSMPTQTFKGAIQCEHSS